MFEELRNADKAPYQLFPEPSSESFRILEFKGKNPSCAWHFHPECQLSLIIKGEGERVVGDSVQEIKQGEVTLLGPNLPHVWRFKADTQSEIHLLVIHFREDFAGIDFLHKPETRAIRLLLSRANLGWEINGADRRAIAAEIKKTASREGFSRMLAFMRVLDEIAHSSSLESICGPMTIPANNDIEVERLQVVCAFVEGNLDAPISRDQAAAQAHMSPSSFSRFFKQRAGITFQDFLNERRIAKACKLLLERDYNITEVAMRCGFANVTSFNRSFRRIKKINPTAYRNKISKVVQLNQFTA